MILRRRSTRKLLTLDSELGSGGEARIYALANDTTLAAKVYHQPTNTRISKLTAMLAQPPTDPMAAKGHVSIAWPVDLLEETSTNRVVGFLMPRINAMRSIIHFYNPTLRSQQCPLFNYAYLHRTARNLAAAVRALHVRNYVIGDVNHDNILAADTALVTLVDTDSFQVPDPRNGTVYRCPVGTPLYTPPELQGIGFSQVDRAVVHDLFGLAVIIFQLLMEGVHPFSGSFTGVSDPAPQPEARITAGHFPYARKRSVSYQPMRVAPPFEVLHPTLRRLFLRCFEDGHSRPALRPTADMWQDALEEAEQALVPCAANDQHRYGNHLTRCPWCERASRLGFDAFPSPQALRNRQYAQAAGFAQKPLSPAGTAHPAPVQPVKPTAPTQVHGSSPSSSTSLAVPLISMLVILFVLGGITLWRFQPHTTTQSPPQPYYDWHACPGEGCIYPHGVLAKRQITAYAKPDFSSSQAFTFSSQQRLIIDDGVVITTIPGKYIVIQPTTIGNIPAHRGDIVYSYTYQGEGTALVWFQGQMKSEFVSYEGVLDVSSRLLKLEREWQGIWWVRARDRNGRIGWIALPDNSSDILETIAGCEVCGCPELKDDFFTAKQVTCQ